MNENPQGKDESFDAGAFMQATVDQPMETEFQLCPEGTYQAMVGDFDEKAIEKFDFTYKNGPKAGQPGSMVKFNLPWSIQDATVLASLGRDSLTIYQQIVLDTAENGALDWGKDRNIQLGRVRKAVNQNNPGAWNVSNLKGAGPALVKVTHETFKRRDGSEGKAARVTAVAPLSGS